MCQLHLNRTTHTQKKIQRTSLRIYLWWPNSLRENYSIFPRISACLTHTPDPLRHPYSFCHDHKTKTSKTVSSRIRPTCRYGTPASPIQPYHTLGFPHPPLLPPDFHRSLPPFVTLPGTLLHFHFVSQLVLALRWSLSIYPFGNSYSPFKTPPGITSSRKPALTLMVNVNHLCFLMQFTLFTI